MKNLTSWSFKVADNQITAALKTIQQNFAGMEAGVGKAEAKFNAFAVGAANKLDGIRAGFKKNFNNLADEIPQLDGLRRVVTNPLAQAVAGAAAMGVYLKDATALSAEFDKSMAKVNVTLQKSPAELRNIGNQVAEIARKNGLANLSDAPLALNKIVSAGIDDTKQALALLDPTLKAAKAGFTDVETVAGAAVSVIKSSGIDNATRVYDVLFATLNKGNAEFRDIANYLPQIIPSARAAGVSLEEVGGSFAYLTAQGLRSEQASTGLKNFVEAIGNTDRVKAFKGLGVEVFDKATGKMRGVLPIIADLKVALSSISREDQRAKILDSLGLNDEARMVVNSMTQNIGELAKTIDFTTNSTGQFAKAVESSKSLGDEWGQTLANLNAVKRAIGNVALPIITAGLHQLNEAFNVAIGFANNFGNTVAPMIDWVRTNADQLAVGAGVLGIALLALNAGGITTALVGFGQLAIGAAVATARTVAYGIANTALNLPLKLAAAAQWALNAALSANPIGLVIAAIAILSGAIYIAYQRSETFRGVIAGIIAVGQAAIPIFKGLGETIIGAFTFNPALIKKGFEDAYAGIQDIAKKGGISGVFNGGYNAKIQQELSVKLKDTKGKAIAAPQTPPTNQLKDPLAAIAGQLGNQSAIQKATQKTLANMEQNTKGKANTGKTILVNQNGLEIVNNTELTKAAKPANLPASTYATTPQITSPTIEAPAALVNNTTNINNNANSISNNRSGALVNQLIGSVTVVNDQSKTLSVQEFERLLEQTLLKIKNSY